MSQGVAPHPQLFEPLEALVAYNSPEQCFALECVVLWLRAQELADVVRDVPSSAAGDEELLDAVQVLVVRMLPRD